MPTPQLAVAPAAPAAPSSAQTGTDASRELLHPDTGSRSLALWGSSSMSSEGGAEATPLPMRIHEHLALSAAPATVRSFGVGATRSAHTLLMRGLDTPFLDVVGSPDPESARVQVSLDSGLGPAGPLQIPGTVEGTAGMLDGSDETWCFTPDDGSTPITGGRFTSSLAETVQDSRQVLWMGKNNILDVDGVLEHTHRMWDAAAHPEVDTLVLGHWCTEADARGSASGNAVAAVNTAQAARYGTHFLDVQHLLTGEEGLRSSPIASLQLLDQGTTQDALDRGVVPPLLVASDGIHLNGWGNLAVSWAIVRRMRELRWL